MVGGAKGVGMIGELKDLTLHEAAEEFFKKAPGKYEKQRIYQMSKAGRWRPIKGRAVFRVGRDAYKIVDINEISRGIFADGIDAVASRLGVTYHALTAALRGESTGVEALYRLLLRHGIKIKIE